MKLKEIIYANFLVDKKYSKNGNAISPILNLYPLFYEFQGGIAEKDCSGISYALVQTLAFYQLCDVGQMS